MRRWGFNTSLRRIPKAKRFVYWLGFRPGPRSVLRSPSLDIFYAWAAAAAATNKAIDQASTVLAENTEEA